MHTFSFSVVAVPLLVTVLVLAAGLLLQACPSLDSASSLVHIGLRTQGVLICFRVVLILRAALFSLPANAKLPTAPSDKAADKFGLPLLEELVRFLLVAWSISTPEVSASQALTVATVYAVNKLVCNLVTFSPVDYASKYEKFERFYSMFLAHTLGAVSKTSFVSMSTSDSGATLVPSEELVADVEPAKPVFNLDSFKTLSPRPLMPILCPATSQQTQPNTDYLYSVSPKNTLHPELHIDDDDLDVHSFAPHDSSSIHTTDSHYDGGGGGGLRVTLPNGARISVGGGAGFHYDNPSHSRHNSTTSLGYTSPDDSKVHPLRWFAWLLPLKVGKKEMTPGELKMSIRKKLSTYTLNSDTASLKSSTCMPLYGTIDLESQVTSAKRENLQRFYEFARFSNDYLDSWSSSFSGILREIDPAFIRYGVTLPDMSPAFFLLQLVSIILWQFLATMLCAVRFANVPLFAGAAAALIVLKLFCGNYLHSQCTMSYRFSIAVETVLNATLFTGVYLYHRV